MESLFGLPAHPMFVHLPVVMVPVAALLSLVLAARPTIRSRFSTWLAALTGIGLIGTVMASRSGEAFYHAIEDRIGDIADDHQLLGEQTTKLVILFFVATVTTALFDRFLADRDRRLAIITSLGAIGTAVIGLVATVWMIRTGHEGARIVWDGVLPSE